LSVSFLDNPEGFPLYFRKISEHRSAIGREPTKTIQGNEAIMQDSSSNPTVVFKTSLGTFEAVLYQDKAPITVENFLQYVKDSFFNGTIFHRIIPGFMAQGGGFDKGGQQKPTRPAIKNEAENGLKNEQGTLAMARTMVIDSATSQFFINFVDNSFLDYAGKNNFGYAVFGKVTEGMDVVDALAKVKTGSRGPFQDWPLEDVMIESVTLKS